MKSTTRRILFGAGALVLFTAVLLIGWLALGWFSPSLPDDPSVVALVNGEEIHRSQIDFKRRAARISQQNGMAQIEAAQGMTAEQKATFIAQLEAAANRTDEEILDELIADKVLVQAAKKQGLEPTDDEAKERANEAYEQIKERATAANAPDAAVQAYRILLDYMTENSLSEDEYVQKTVGSYRDQIAVERLYSANGEMDDEYVQSLVKKADVKRR